MKLNKTTKKIDDNICKALTEACESLKNDIEGFLWLTHRVNYTNFPSSLIVTCVFESNNDIENLINSELDLVFRHCIQKQLLKVGVVLNNAKNNIQFDSEESCLATHNGQWAERLTLKVTKQKPQQRQPRFSKR